MIRDLAIYGAGGFGREMALMVDQINEQGRQWNLVGFFDDGKDKGAEVDNLPVLGGLQMLNGWKKRLAVVVALADPHIRASLVAKFDNPNLGFPVMVHPQSLRGSASNEFARGTIITAGCILTTGIRLDEFVVINLSCTIGHDVTVGSFSSIMPGCNISGAVTIGSATLIGTGTQILQNLSVGNNCKVGAGAVVTRSINDGLTAVGVPAKKRSGDTGI